MSSNSTNVSTHLRRVPAPQNHHSDGGIVWPVDAAQDGNFSLFPYAKSGATCSNTLTPRPYLSVFESQLPTYLAEKANGSLGHLWPEETLYTLWIGTNDLGVGQLLTAGQKPGVTVVDTVTCAVNWVQTLYNSGARNFIFQNVSPARTTCQTSLTEMFLFAADGPARDDAAVLGQLVPEQVLDRAAQHDGVERLHEGAHHRRQRHRPPPAPAPRPDPARRARR